MIGFSDLRLAPFLAVYFYNSVVLPLNCHPDLNQDWSSLDKTWIGLVLDLIWTLDGFWAFRNVDFQRVIYFRPHPAWTVQDLEFFSAPNPLISLISKPKVRKDLKSFTNKALKLFETTILFLWIIWDQLGSPLGELFQIRILAWSNLSFRKISVTNTIFWFHPGYKVFKDIFFLKFLLFDSFHFNFVSYLEQSSQCNYLVKIEMTDENPLWNKQLDLQYIL